MKIFKTEGWGVCKQDPLLAFTLHSKPSVIFLSSNLIPVS